MLFLSEEDAKSRLDKLAAAMEGDHLQGGRQIVQDLPDFAMGWMLLGAATASATESQDALWKALSLEPCRAVHYLNLADRLTEIDATDATAKELRALALWKVALSAKVEKVMGDHFETLMGAEAWEPESYEILAEAQERENAKSRKPLKIADRLRPYYLLNKLQQQASDEMESSDLDAILDARVECEPLLRNALRQWARTEDALDDPAASRLVAVLGEIAGPDFAEELTELVDWGDREMFLHTHWALHRMGERHPDAVREAFRKSSQGEASVRSLIAEQLLLADPLEGDVEILTSLLNNFDSIASSGDAQFLLAAVVAALLRRGETSAARRLADQYSPSLGRKGRELVRESLAGNFMPVLKELGVLDLTLDDICIGCALMEEEEDEEALDEDELDEEVDLAPALKPGRNDPCWCGSGKKYKKCHLAADEEAAREEPIQDPPQADVSLHTALMSRVFEAVREWHRDSDLRRAKKMYFGESGNIEASEHDINGFVQWLLHDFRDAATRATGIEYFLRTRGAKLTPAERTLLESLRDARFGLFEAVRVQPGSGIELRDIFVGDRMFVHDITSSREMHRWDCLLARVQFHEGRWILAGDGSLVPRNLLAPLREFVERESLAARQSPAEFARANSHQLHRVVKRLYDRQLSNLRVVNNEGEEIAFGKSEYEISDVSALLAKLLTVEELEEGKPDPSGNPWFTWVQPMGEESRPLGHLEIENGILRLEAMSRTRLATLRGLAEFHASDFIRHRGDHYTSMDEIKERVPSGQSAPDQVEPPSPEAQAAITELIARHYAGWADEKLPALGGKTARQAVRSKAGRQAVIDLLHLMENAEQRKEGRDGPAYDFNIIRRQLGLPEE